MKKLFRSADAYLKACDWKDLAMVKCCLFSMGVLVGTHLSPKRAVRAEKWARRVFVMTYVPLMGKYARVVKKIGR